ncbi:hypothetical protein D0T49_03620 [Paludibacter sp. 221]|uniref:hypothetical protein n=1 Tax=Paludibacter sp. 221 TaxID=2302939 RepID=UPI0013D2CE30|nr:hypothetical protein [Paludibacter sp. 221]NDV46129.1 hypothetical protein [Paludibacter sp. 221]
MKKFSELGIEIETGKNMFQVPKIQITEIINCEIEVLDFEKDITTRHGDGRYILKIKYNGNEYKFFTNAAKIKEALDKIPKTEFPFQTTIKQESFGTGRTFYFT